MCGRFSLNVDPTELQTLIPDLIVDQDVIERYNIAPSQGVATVLNEPVKKLNYIQWGLIPHWAKDPKIGNKMINARGETVHEKPSFRSSFKSKRCLILADGFYEWKTLPGGNGKLPVYFRLSDAKPFAFAGIWDSWNGGNSEPLRTCCIITTSANELISTAHHCMPVILPPSSYDLWLQPGVADIEELKGVLKQYPSEKMVMYPVSTKVNNVRNDESDLVLPLFGNE